MTNEPRARVRRYPLDVDPWELHRELHRDARACIVEAQTQWEAAARFAARGAFLAAIERRDEAAISAVLGLECLLGWLAGLSAD
jgi:hypothetical protein